MITQRRMTSESKLKAITKKHKITGGGNYSQKETKNGSKQGTEIKYDY